jgi:hypothetical protein
MFRVSTAKPIFDITVYQQGILMTQKNMILAILARFIDTVQKPNGQPLSAIKQTAINALSAIEITITTSFLALGAAQ